MDTRPNRVPGASFPLIFLVCQGSSSVKISNSTRHFFFLFSLFLIFPVGYGGEEDGRRSAGERREIRLDQRRLGSMVGVLFLFLACLKANLHFIFGFLVQQSAEHLGCDALPPPVLGGWTGRNR